MFGSALDRLIGDAALRSRMASQVSDQDLSAAIGEDGAKKLAALDKVLNDAALPHGIKLGLTSSQGISIGALIGLLADKGGVDLPIASWGAGTRRMAALQIASCTKSSSRITVIDEVERGLEPYRLRQLIKALSDDGGQSFMTTHSAVAIGCALESELWYLDSSGKIGSLTRKKVASQQRRDPETFLARLAVIVEGETEMGFLGFFLRKSFAEDWASYGIRLCLGQGNAQTLDLLEALNSSGLAFAGLVDDEGDAPGRWATLKAAMGARLLQWRRCTEIEFLDGLDDAQLPELFSDENGELVGMRLRSVADQLGIADKTLPSIIAALEQQDRTLRDLIACAATGSRIGAANEAQKKEWAGHGKLWFKSVAGGEELALKAVRLGALTRVRDLSMPLLNAIRNSCGLDDIPDLLP